MNSEETLRVNKIIQQVNILATGAPVTAQFRDELFKLYMTTGNWEKIAVVIDNYMNGQLSLVNNGVSGLVQMVAFNGFGLKLSAVGAELITNHLISNGIDTWSKLFEITIHQTPDEFKLILDHRASHAEIFTEALSIFNKEHGYYHSYSMNAAREWLQGIHVFDGSALEARASAVRLINKMEDGSISGRVFSGNISNATVFMDRNDNNVLDSDEISTITDKNGTFILPAIFSEGAYKAVGGIDLESGTPFPFTLTAPEGSVMLTPLTTLTALMLRNGLAENLDNAEALLFKSLNMVAVDLSVYDHMASALHGDNLMQQIAAIKMKAAITQITNIFNVAFSLTSHFLPAGDRVIEQIILNTLVKHLVAAANAGQSLDLSNQKTIIAIFNDIALASGIKTQGSPLQKIDHFSQSSIQVTKILNEVNTIVDQSVRVFESGEIDNPVSALSDIVKLGILVNTKITSTIDEKLSTGDLEAIVIKFTGNGLLQQVAVVEAGYFDNHIAVNAGTFLTNITSSAPIANAGNANSVPVISNLSGDNLSYTEGDGAVVIEQSNNASVTDPDSADFATGSLTVSFQAGSDSAEDVISIVNQGVGVGQIGVTGGNVTYGGVLIGTVTGGSGGSNLVVTLNNSATAAAVTALVKNITYENTDTASPTTGVRTIRYVLTDGNGGTSVNYDATVTVSGANDAPINTVPSAQSVTEDTLLALSGISIADADGNLSTVQLAVSNGTLNVTLAGSATIGTGANGSASLTLSGNQTDLNSTLASLSYLGASNFSGSDTLTVSSTDGNGAVDIDTVAITISATNDIPVISNLSGDNLSYTEGDGAVVIEQSNNASVADVDSADFATGSLTVSFQAGSDSAEDVISIVNQGVGVGQIGVTGGNVTYGGVLIGTVAGGSGGSNLVVTLNNSATAAAVTALVKNITYENTDTASPTTGVRTIRYVLTDGDGGTSANYGATVTVSGVVDDNETVLDQFGSASFSNNNGTANWSSSWQETDSNGGGASGGRIRIDGGRLDIRADAVADNIYREVDLSGATSAALSFTYSNSLGTGDTIVIEVSNNGGGSYSTLTGGTFTQSLNSGSGTFNFDISSYISANTRIRFRVTTESDNDHLYVDNVQVSYTVANHEPIVTSASTFNINENQTIVTSIAATDADGDTLTYGISGGDAALFTIHPLSGLLSFNSPPDFEAPADGNGDNIYNLTVQADDGRGGVDTQTMSVQVIDIFGF